MGDRGVNAAWMLIRMELGDSQRLHFEVLRRAIQMALESDAADDWARGVWDAPNRREAGWSSVNADEEDFDLSGADLPTPILGLREMTEVRAPPVEVRADMRRSSGYICPGAYSREAPTMWADDPECPIEVEYRHPGDVEDDDDPAARDAGYRWDVVAPVTTKAAMKIKGLVFASPDIDGGACTLEAFAPGQLCIRVDNQRKLLVYDCFAWKLKCIDYKSEAELPSNREMRKADKMHAKMLGYDPHRGEWTLEVAHF